MTNRYRVVRGSQSASWCFTRTVVDTLVPLFDGRGEQLRNLADEPVFCSVCECQTEAFAELVATALNSVDRRERAAQAQGRTPADELVESVRAVFADGRKQLAADLRAERERREREERS